MDIQGESERIVTHYLSKRREEALVGLRIAVSRCVAGLRESGRLAVLAAFDRELIVEHVEFDLEHLLLRYITEQDIEQLVNESLEHEVLSPVPPVSLPDQPEGEVWEAVEINRLLYCLNCRSIYEGKPLTDAQLKWLREGESPVCAACESDL